MLWKKFDDFIDFDDKNIDWDFVLGEDKEIDVLEAENIDDRQTPPSDVSTGTTYKCPVCEKKYKSSSGLRSHAKKIHAKILKASEHKVKDCCEETNNEDLVSSSCQDEDSTASSTNKSRKNVSSDVTVKKGYCRPPPVYTKEALENELSRLIVQALTEVGEDVNLKVPNSVYGLGIAHIACSIVDKVKAGSSFPSTMISELTHHLWKTVTSGDSDNTYSQYNETIWHSFFNMWANNNDVTKLMMDTFCDLLAWSTVDNDQLFRTVRLFMFRLIVIVRKQRDRADKPAVIDDEVSVSEISEEECQALRYFVGYIPYKLRHRFIRQKNVASRAFVSVLDDMKDDGDEECSLSEDTMSKQWIHKQNRGGLFHVSDQTFLFFKQVECVCKEYLQAEKFVANGQNIQQPLIDAIMHRESIHSAWAAIARKAISEDVSATLLSQVLRLYVNIRCYSFARSILELYKRKHRKHLKGSKGLRKSLC